MAMSMPVSRNIVNSDSLASLDKVAEESVYFGTLL